VLPARGSRRQVLELIERMRPRVQPRIQPDPGPRPAGRETDLSVLIAAAHAGIKRRTTVFLVSDFLGVPGWERALGLLAQRHEVVAVRLYDPLENVLPDLGLVVLQDAETGEQLFVDGHDGAFRGRFAQAAAAREKAVRAALTAAGVDCLELCTAEPLDAALVRFIRLRKRRSQLAAGGVPSAHKAGGVPASR